MCLCSSNYAQQSGCFNEFNVDIYSPCFCEETEQGSLNITCFGDLVTNQDIQRIFQDSTAPEINRFALIPAVTTPGQPDGPDLIQVIDNLLSDKRARIIEIATCPPGSTLQISPSAFRTSNVYAQEFSITDCDIDRLDWLFLRTFSRIVNVRLTTVSGINSIRDLPILRNAEQLTFDNCFGFDIPLNFPAASLPALKTLNFVGNTDLDNPVADNILLALATASVPLTNLNIRQSPLITLVPKHIGDISSLTSINLSNNQINSVDSNAFSFINDRSVRFLNLSNNAVNTISYNAFSTGSNARSRWGKFILTLITPRSIFRQLRRSNRAT